MWGEAIRTTNYNESTILHQTASCLAVDVELRLMLYHFHNTQCFFLRRRKIFVTGSSSKPLNSYRSSTKRVICTINIILLRSFGYTVKRIIFFITSIIKNNYTSDVMQTYKGGHSYSSAKYLTAFS
jgi:hypothetical protein